MWELTCLLCLYAETDLVRTQEHAMTAHAVPQAGLMVARRRGPIKGLRRETYEWTLPDGRTWLRAVRQPEEEPRC